MYKYISFFILATLLYACAASPEKAEKADDFEKLLVISELMASNSCGIMAADGKLYDWIELCNVSDEEIDLKNYTLALLKDSCSTDKSTKPEEKKSKKKHKKNKKKANATDASTLLWQLPSVALKPGEHILIFASKKDASEGKELHASFKLPSKGATLRLISRRGKLLSEVAYPSLEPNVAYARTANGKYEKSHIPTPGFENTPKGFEAYNALLDSQRKSAVLIWEFQPQGEEKSTPWVEIRNVSTQPVSLKGYALTSNPDKPSKWEFPNEVLAPGATFLVNLAGKKAGKGNSHKANFKPSDNCVMLFKKGKFIDGVSAHACYHGLSVGRKEGKKGFFIFREPTPDAENTAKAFRFIAAAPTFSEAPGTFTKGAHLCLKIDGKGKKVRYTLDGSCPTPSSPLYQDSIVLKSTATVRAISVGDSTSLPSEVATATFFVGEKKHDLPVICISVNPSDLYDYTTGIYADGPGKGNEFPYIGANYWKDWEKSAHVALYDGKKGFSTDCGLKIFGGFSRALAKKSFSIKFREQYGTPSVTYDYFNDGSPEELKTLVLRSGSQDIDGVMLRDEFFTSLMAEASPHLLIQPYRPVALYVNNEYFGLYYMREKIDKNFVARHLNVSNDSVSIAMSKYTDHGNIKPLTDLYEYASGHKLTEKQHYDYVAQHMDLEGLADHIIGQLYACNSDYGNVRITRSTDPGCDQKWHFVYYDLDSSWAGNTRLANYLDPTSTICPHQAISHAIIRNASFRQLFLERLSHHLHHTLSAKHTTSVLKALAATIRTEMKRNCERWPAIMAYTTWEKNLTTFEQKCQSRPKSMLDDVRAELRITKAEEQKYFADLGY